MTNPNTPPFLPPQMRPAPLYRQPGVVAALIVFVGMIIAGLMVWQPGAAPKSGLVNTGFDQTRCVTYKETVDCEWSR